MSVLIAGGAGYIGSTVASACLDQGMAPVILDSLVRGRREFTDGRIFYEGDISDGALVDRIFSEHPDISAVVHCAALIVVPESVEDPIGYYEANVAKSLRFVGHLRRNGCDRLIFSSSASIYQADDGSPVNEDSPLAPQSPYARTKAVCEGMFADIAAARQMRVLSLRYFNPVGADPKMRTGLQLKRPSHALGMMIQAHREGTAFPVTGTNYPTRDGTGIRDYVHVWDLAAAHVVAIGRFDSLLSESEPSMAINLGTGSGTTVRELCAAFNQVVDTPLATVDTESRPGDVAGGYTKSDRAQRLLGWTPQLSLEEGIRSSLDWIPVRDVMLKD
ncbi:UDP-glucose 4-epimerase GalE [Streptomyces griseocarneus]|uniref:UDP-glucose 4-epimerase GalE n=1 Tax=Streptomyces griseocarneus TaxID=51201 RepID=UPI00167CE40A|nr:UDP-glucose 4-epimerase GalE [Streptomyces griseocarneus]MBZ6476703.1 UDP-glucose 4-epimerase GalE [Streptomyces griseocarneus]GHG80437.1 UDP-glucose 4-epimerase GalE [Streptomyces griseocarneus]